MDGDFLKINFIYIFYDIFILYYLLEKYESLVDKNFNRLNCDVTVYILKKGGRIYVFFFLIYVLEKSV